MPIFRLGVALRMRHESRAARDRVISSARSTSGTPPSTSTRTSTSGGGRIQQYGPRLIKPYPFYDWVAGGHRRPIAARGESAGRADRRALTGAEIAQPSARFRGGPRATERLRPIPTDASNATQAGLVETEVTVVPPQRRGRRDGDTRARDPAPQPRSARPGGTTRPSPCACGSRPPTGALPLGARLLDGTRRARARRRARYAGWTSRSQAPADGRGLPEPARPTPFTTSARTRVGSASSCASDLWIEIEIEG